MECVTDDPIEPRHDATSPSGWRCYPLPALDLNKLKIDREAAPKVARSSGGGRRRALPVGKLVFIGLLAGAVWTFWNPLLGLVDRYRLLEVATTKPARPSKAAASALAGAAANGFIIARTKAALSADQPGRIVAMNVVEGQAVKKGFVVARLYADEFEATLRQAKANADAGQAAIESANADVATAHAEIERQRSQRAAIVARKAEAQADLALANVQLKRVEDLIELDYESASLRDEWVAKRDAATARIAANEADLHTNDALTKESEARAAAAQRRVAEVRAQQESLLAAVKFAEAALDKTYVRAPFDGVVVLKDAEVGEVVSPNSQAGGSARGAVATMVDFASLEVQAEVPETTIAQVKLGSPAQIFLDAYPEHGYSGVVDRIWPTARKQTATIEVRVRIEDPDDKLRPEMGVRVVFTEQKPEATPADAGDDALQLPADVLVRVDGKDGVFVLERDVARFRAVGLSTARGDKIAVKTGLTERDVVVRSPPPQLEDGDRVRTKDL